MMIADITPTEICRSLNDRGIMSPATLSMSRGMKSKWKGGFDFYLWTPRQVERIIKDEVYFGNLVQLKSEVKILGGKQIKKSKDEWIRRNGTHEAIITQEEYDLANSKISHYEKRYKHNPRNIYYCGKCGRMLQNQNRGTLFCRQAKFKSNHGCSDVLINKAKADQTVLKSIQYPAEEGI